MSLNLIEEQKQLAEKREKSFFDHFGIKDEEKEFIMPFYKSFLEDFKKAGMGRGFFDSPLGRKSFFVGFFRGRIELKKRILDLEGKTNFDEVEVLKKQPKENNFELMKLKEMINNKVESKKN